MIHRTPALRLETVASQRLQHKTLTCLSGIAPLSNGQYKGTNMILLQSLKTRFFNRLVKKSGKWDKELPTMLWAIVGISYALKII
jgi:hypothetical protein